jgi:heat shock protein HslJ
LILTLLFLAFAGLTIACSAGGKADQPDLAGTEWTLVSLNGEPLLAGTEIDVYFEETHLGGKMTCNGYGGGPDSGRYSAKKDGTLDVPMLAVTLQACESPKGVMEQEAAYIKTLQGAARYRVVGDSLEIEDAAGETMLVFARK